MIESNFDNPPAWVILNPHATALQNPPQVPHGTLVPLHVPQAQGYFPISATKLMKPRINLLIALTLLLTCGPMRGQSVIYSLSYSETQASRRIRFPNGVIGAPIDDRLAMLRNLRKTEIYSVSIADGKRTLLFSDEGMNLEISPAGPVGNGKAYVTGLVREWRTTPIPGAYSQPLAIYEINLDGSRQFRRVVEIQPNQPPALVNRQATKGVVETFVDGKYMVFVYDLPGWKLLHSWELTKVSQPHCPSCTPISYGWLADGQRLFFKLDVVGDIDADTLSKHDRPGTYLASESGDDLGAIPAEIGRLELAGYMHPNFIIRDFIGQLPDGSYVFQDYATKQGKSPGETEPFLVIANPDSKAQKQFPQRFPVGGHLSPSGKYMSCIEDRRTANYQVERHLWVEDLQSGQEKELFSIPPPQPPTSPEPNVSFNVLGWMNDK